MPLLHQSRACAALLATLVLAGCVPAPEPIAPPAIPTVSPAPTIAPSPTAADRFQSFLEQHDAVRQAFGQPYGVPVWIDGRLAQFFERGRLELGAAGIISKTLAAGWHTEVPADLFALAASTRHASISAPPQAEPLLPITATLSIPGYSGPAELRVYDGRMRPVGTWPADIRDGIATLAIEGRGALGGHAALVLIDGRIAGASSLLFALDAQTSIQTGQPRFDTLYPRVRTFMEHDVTTYSLDGATVRGYRSPDNDMLWLRDHTHQGRAFRYFERDMTSLIDAFRRAQQPDGSFPDYLARPEYGVVAGRMQVEADLEYLFVQAVYEAWQATGDDAWLKQNLEAMRRAIRYTTSDPLRWDTQRQLIKRPLTIDTWDFEYGPTTTDPTSGKLAPRHWIDDRTIWGIFHGDNTGLAYALRLLARVEQHLGDPATAAHYRTTADGVIERLNALSWNGSFFRHFVPLEPFDVPGVDEARQLSLSNTYALNREVLQPDQGHAIVAEYDRRNQDRGATFAEWYSIDPPFPAGLFGLAGHLGERPGEYVNGGIMPLVGGELARGSFRYGAEHYGFDILARYFRLISITGESYLWYYPAGNPGKSSADTLPTDGWGSSAMLGALIEGAAGIEDRDALYRDVTLSPRWSAAEDVDAARVVARYAASNGYVAYQWQRTAHTLALSFTGSGERVRLRLLLPEGAGQITQVLLDGAQQAYQIEEVFGSRYVDLTIEHGSGTVEVIW